MNEDELSVEHISPSELEPHPENYRNHGDEQIEHIKQSIQENGFYKNIVIAKDNVILAGHGVHTAATSLGIDQVPVVRVDTEHTTTKAKKILTGDNELHHLSYDNERELNELLQEIQDEGDLLGTGYDDEKLGAFDYITDDEDDHPTENEDHLEGVPSIDEDQDVDESETKLIIHYRNKEHRQKFIDELDLEVSNSRKETKTAWWPHRQEAKNNSLQLVPPELPEGYQDDE
jgi:ParB-like chromosome segregation protein Spo0J